MTVSSSFNPDITMFVLKFMVDLFCNSALGRFVDSGDMVDLR